MSYDLKKEHNIATVHTAKCTIEHMCKFGYSKEKQWNFLTQEKGYEKETIFEAYKLLVK